MKLYCKNFDYELITTKAQFITELKKSTKEGTFNYYKHYKDYTFYGKISENNFEIKSVPASSKRYLFNPLIIGRFKKENNKTILSIKMELSSSDYIFIGMLFILCIFFGVIIYFSSLENSNLIPLIFILPLAIFLLMNCLLLFFARINFSDAIFNIEKIIKSSVI